MSYYAVTFVEGGRKYYAVKTRTENVEGISRPEKRCLFKTECEGRALLQKVINSTLRNRAALVRIDV